MSDEALDIEPVGDSLDGMIPKDPDDAAEGAGEALKAKRPKKAKHQGRGRRVNREDPGEVR